PLLIWMRARRLSHGLEDIIPQEALDRPANFLAIGAHRHGCRISSDLSRNLPAASCDLIVVYFFSGLGFDSVVFRSIVSCWFLHALLQGLHRIAHQPMR